MFYKIKGGCSFRDSDGSIKTGGEFIELDDETAELHKDKLDGKGLEDPAAPEPVGEGE